MRILIAEDEQAMLKIIRIYLENAGYEVDTAINGEDAFEKVSNQHYDLIVVDWMMPVMNGIELCKLIRLHSIPIKIIMLTAKGEIDDEITALSCGADDYIRKPFEPKVLLLRIKKLLQLENIIQIGDLILDQTRNVVMVNHKEVDITQKELSLLQVLMQNKGITVTRETLLQQVWGIDYKGDERTLDTHIRRLRNKIGNQYIKTYIGIGYRLDDFDE